MSTLSLFIIFFILIVLLAGALPSQVGGLNFNYTDFPDQIENDFIRNNSYIALRAIQVTPDVNGQPITNMSGRIWYGKQFKLWRKKKGGGRVWATFNTTFIIRIKPQTVPGGEGLAFILTGDNTLPENSHGEWLGIVNSATNGSDQARIVAVEFDTRKSFPEDLDDNHVGLDVNSIYSVKQESLTSHGVNISSDKDVTFHVQYDGKNLTVFVGTDMQNPVLSTAIDLSEYLPQKVFMGFSGSTGSYTELNCVRLWNFNGTDIDESNLLWVWIVIPVGLLLLIAIASFMYWKKKSKQKAEEEVCQNIELVIAGYSTAPQKFNLKELSKATDKFDPRNKLGKGGFGTVYKGILGNKVVAVKKVSEQSTQGKQEFIAEVTTIGNLHHRNLVKLIGWCYEKHEFLLVYEYMPNGSLDKFIFHDARSGMQEPKIGWGTRVSVISGVAQALDYLHNGCDKRVIHRDIKASNIMLDSEFNARLGDFGLARAIKLSDQTHHSTQGLAGTPGYIAPEVIFTGRATVETDVYAFGVLVLEVACGRKPGGQNEENDYNSNIVNWLWDLHGQGRILDGADPRLEGDFKDEEMQCMLILGLACCHPNPNKRPSMKAVLQVLTEEAPPPEVPTDRPRFMWPPMPLSFKDSEYSLTSGQCTPFSELTGR